MDVRGGKTLRQASRSWHDWEGEWLGQPPRQGIKKVQDWREDDEFIYELNVEFEIYYTSQHL